MLDDLRQIHERDTKDALGAAERQWQQLADLGSATAVPETINTILFAGQGLAAVAAEIAALLPDCSLPLLIQRNSTLPSWVSVQTYVVVCDYDGRTTDALQIVAEAVSSGAQVAVISSGGALADLAKNSGYPLVRLPFNAQLTGLVQAVLSSIGRSSQTRASADFIKQAALTLVPTLATKANLAKQLALEIIGTSVVIGSTTDLVPAAQAWKLQLNQLAKHVAWCASNNDVAELAGWSKQPVDKPYAVIELRSDALPDEHKRLDLAERLLSGQRPQSEVVLVQGSTPLERLLWAAQLGDFVACYVALLNGLDPSARKLIESYKQQEAAL